MLGKPQLLVMAVSALAIGFAADHSPGSNARPGMAPVPSVTSGHLVITLELSPVKPSLSRLGAVALAGVMGLAGVRAVRAMSKASARPAGEARELYGPLERISGLDVSDLARREQGG
jgi:hypothetical protein